MHPSTLFSYPLNLCSFLPLRDQDSSSSGHEVRPIHDLFYFMTASIQILFSFFQ
jgi:hypothetical protein